MEKELRLDLEHLRNLFVELYMGKQCDPSWFRPKVLSSKEREDKIKEVLALIDKNLRDLP